MVKLTLLDSADYSHAFMRETLMRLWGVHGYHDPQAASLPQAVAHLIQLGRGKHLELTLGNPVRHTLPDRLSMIGTLLNTAHLPLNYTPLLSDILYFGPAVAQRWRTACRQAQRSVFNEQEHK
ncbi:hypothetical protein GCM10008957_33030 [Deinococcus ruber]|uniref:Uncharacterized protein n=2 Tax=Deinococcus ruber TaxID=1848197 RepID=A0A918F7Z7_9DEIO|nr:hypothetical protein GCM10008957_33030 [Deinococcus ruber]